jgi:hypothetical protein
MNSKTFLALAALAASFAVGCSSSPAPVETSTPGVVTAELAKCAQCGKELAKVELVAHDGKMLCKDCIATHNH